MINRRQFIYLSAFSTAALTLSGHKSFALSANQMDYQRWLVFGMDKDFARFDPMTQKLQSVVTPTKAHSFQAFPGDLNRVVGLEKWGRSLSVVDFKTEKLVRSIEPSGPGRYFYGHLVFTRNGRQFISTQTDTANSKGYLVWYDRETLKPVDEFELAHGGSHDLAFLPGTDIIAITSSGLAPDYDHPENGPVRRIGPSVVIFFDTKAKTIVRQWDLATGSTFPGHLKVSSTGQVYVATSVFYKYKGEQVTRTFGSLYDTNPNQPLREWDIPEHIRSTLKSEMLSLEINEELNRLGVTNPSSNQLLTFDLDNRRFLSATRTNTSGIAWDAERKLLYGLEPERKELKKLDKMNGFTFEQFSVPKQSSHLLLVKEARSV